jgi:3-dehydroquinate synthase
MMQNADLLSGAPARGEAGADSSGLWIKSSAGEYQLVVAPGALKQLPAQLDALGIKGRCWIITDTTVGPLYLDRIVELVGPSRPVLSYAVPAGEQSKSLALAETLYTWMLEGGVERRDVVLALGGGVVGDLAGFVASTVLRGVELIQLPTTVQAMIDSSMGGKTGVNHARGKNLIGTFYPARVILADTTTLRSLPRREFAAGVAEAIKHGVIADAALFDDLEANLDALYGLAEPITGELIRRSAAVKAAVVTADERELGVRMLLNYGHTLGHALEAAAGYGALLHGEAVSIGMELAGQIAIRTGRYSEAELARQRALLRAAGLPIAPPPGLTADAVLAAVGLDKKRDAGTVRWILPERIGSAVVVRDVPPALVREVLEQALT